MGRDSHRPPPTNRGIYFNPRARVGRDSQLLFDLTLRRDFNPRARVGRDKKVRGSCSSCIHFNPRARVGRDWLVMRFMT